MTDLAELAFMLSELDIEAKAMTVSASARSRILALRNVLPVIEQAREKTARK